METWSIGYAFMEAWSTDYVSMDTWSINHVSMKTRVKDLLQTIKRFLTSWLGV